MLLETPRAAAPSIRTPASGVKHDDPIDEVDAAVELVLDDDDGASPIGHQIAQHREHRAGAGRVQVGGRLVQHQHVGLHRQQAGQRQPLLHASRELIARVSSPCRPGRRCGAPRRCGPACRRGVYPGSPGRMRPRRQGQHAELGFRVLEEDTDAAAQLAGGDLANRAASQEHAPVHGRPDRAGDDAVQAERQRALANRHLARGAGLAPRALWQIDRAQSRAVLAVVADGEALDLDSSHTDGCHASAMVRRRSSHCRPRAKPFRTPVAASGSAMSLVPNTEKSAPLST